MGTDDKPPRLFTKVNSSDINYNSDFIQYCVTQEVNRLKAAGQVMSDAALLAFKQELVRKIMIGRPDLALDLKMNIQNLFETR